ncbi:MAG TPA: hypothetical protein VFG69_12125 [Nannocystaceae bacterium]|nr:hypothetical protein [Nannocystaceae bacterium]
MAGGFRAHARAIGLASLLPALAGCDPPPPRDELPPAAAALLAEVRAADYRTWTQPPEFPAHTIGRAPHGFVSDVWLDPTMAAAMTDTGLTAWPEGATLVSDGYDEAAEAVVAIQIMRKRDGAWTWAQYGADDTPLLYGTSLACSHCHAAGADFVRTVAFAE